MSRILTIIDPQNDFMDTERSALAVPGASADMVRLSNLIRASLRDDYPPLKFDEIVVTLDSHASYGVERTTFWQDENGNEVAPFTQVSLESLKSGKTQPRNLDQYEEVLAMVTQLQERRGQPMTVWPVHCVVGTWGHNIEENLAVVLAQWEQKTKKAVRYVFKGQSPMTEHFSAIGAEVQLAHDPRTHTNHELLAFLGRGQNEIWVAGQAASHCVRFTVEDIWNSMPAFRRNQLTLLTDCMSSVPGFEADTQGFFAKARSFNSLLIQSTNL